jgi:hypothetical protein
MVGGREGEVGSHPQPMEVPLQSLQAVNLGMDGLAQPLAPEMKSRLTVEAAGAASLCRCHDTLNGPFWHGPS